MADKAKAENFMKQAEKELNRWVIWGGPNYLKAAHLYEEAGFLFRKSKSWVQAALVFIKVAECHLMLNSVNYAALSFVDGAQNSTFAKDYGKAIACYEKAVQLFEKIGKSDKACKYCKEIGQLYEDRQKIPMAIFYFGRAATHFQFQQNKEAFAECAKKVKKLRNLDDAGHLDQVIAV
ncbi:hypothetical protein MKW92_035134 [Papaver armeniacum]|nr:hypothetical protein MKW92_035134 [Papaver armeniacum]